MHQDICTLIPSEDASKDIALTALNYSAARWQWPLFIRYGSPDWRSRTLAQLDSLPAQFRFVLLQVEDCVFTKEIDQDTLGNAALAARALNLACLRLTPVARNAIQRAILPCCGDFYHKLSKIEPYYSSWLISVWRRDHLRELVERSANVYEFEHQVPDEDHYAVSEPFLKYECLVGKRQWYRWAAKKYDLPPTRDTETLPQSMRRQLSNLSFQTLGFTSFRIKRAIRDWRESTSRFSRAIDLAKLGPSIRAPQSSSHLAHSADHGRAAPNENQPCDA